MLVAALGVWAGLALSSAGVAQAGPFLALASPVKILSPAAGLVTAAPLQVVVQTAPSLRSFDAQLGARDVKGAFRRVGAKLWVGELTAADGLTPGPQQLAIFTLDSSGRKGVATEELLVGRAVSQFVVLAPASWNQFAPGTTVSFRLGALPSVLSVTLNGHDATGQFEQSGLMRSGSLDQDSGLRYGSNQLVITAAQANGDYTRVTRELTVPRMWPLVSVTGDQRTRSGEVVRLSAAGTIPALNGGRLSYRWALVTKPRGSKAQVLDAGSASPTVKPDVPGDYVVRLQVSELAPPGLAGSRPLARLLSLLPARAEVTLDDSPSILPIGLAVNTMAPLSQFQDRIVLGTGPSDPNYHWYDIGGESGVAMVVLDRSTLAVDASYTYNENDAAYALNAIKSLAQPWAHLVIVSAEQFGAERAAWSDIFTELGATPTTTVSYGNWSVIGVPGAPDGGISNTAGLGDPNDINATEAGSMTGYLREQAGVSYPAYAFVLGQYVSYSTSSAASASQNTMTVDGQSYPSQTLNCPGGGGLQLLALSSLTLAPVASGTYATNCNGNAAGDLAALTSLRSQLDGLTDVNGVPDVLLLQSIGTPFPQASPYPADAVNEWFGVGMSLVRFGGTASVFDNAFGAYALTGGDGLGEPGSLMSYGAEASSWLTGKGNSLAAGSLAGELRRDSEYHYGVMEGEPGSTGAQALTQLIYPQQPQSPWFTISPAVQQQIIPYITDHFLNPRPPSAFSDSNACYIPSYDDVRATYCDTSQAGYWAEWAQELNDRVDPPAGTGFSAADWDAVRTELADELNAVVGVNTFVDNLIKVYGSVGTIPPAVAVQNIYAQVQAQLPVPVGAAPSEASSYASLAGGLFSFGELIPGADFVFGVLAASADLAGEVMANEDGSPGFDTSTLGLTADQLGYQLAKQYATDANQIGSFFNIIVSDPGRLHAFTQANFSSGFNSLANDKADLELSTERTAFGSLMSAAYRLDMIHEYRTTNPPNISPKYNAYCTDNGGSYPCVNNFLCEEQTSQWFPFQSAPPDAQFLVNIPYVATRYGTDSAEAFVVADPTKNGAWYPNPLSSWIGPNTTIDTPTKSLLQPLFDPLGAPETGTQQALGLNKYWFWAHTFGQALVVPGSTATQSPAVVQFAQPSSKPYYLSCEESAQAGRCPAVRIPLPKQRDHRGRATSQACASPKPRCSRRETGVTYVCRGTERRM